MQCLRSRKWGRILPYDQIDPGISLPLIITCSYETRICNNSSCDQYCGTSGEVPRTLPAAHPSFRRTQTPQESDTMGRKRGSKRGGKRTDSKPTAETSESKGLEKFPSLYGSEQMAEGSAAPSSPPSVRMIDHSRSSCKFGDASCMHSVADNCYFFQPLPSCSFEVRIRT